MYWIHERVAGHAHIASKHEVHKRPALLSFCPLEFIIFSTFCVHMDDLFSWLYYFTSTRRSYCCGKNWREKYMSTDGSFFFSCCCHCENAKTFNLAFALKQVQKKQFNLYFTALSHFHWEPAKGFFALYWTLMYFVIDSLFVYLS